MLAEKRRDAWTFVAWVAAAFAVWSAGKADEANKSVYNE